MGYSSLERLVELDRRIRTKQLSSAAELADEYEVSRRTIERDLEQLRATLGATVTYNRKLGRYEYEGDAIALPAQWLTAREIAIILIAERALRTFAGTSFEEEIHPAFNRLLDPVRRDRKMMDRIRELCRAVRFYNPHGKVADVHQQFGVIIDAIMERRRITFEYRPVAEVRTARIQVEPYYLSNDGNTWFLTGYSWKERTIRAFALQTIHGLRLSDRFFVMPDSIGGSD